MFSIIEEKIKKKKKLKFPVIAKSNNNQEVVLFFKEQEGVVIDAGNGRHYLGHAASNWIPVVDARTWRITHEGVQIQLLAKASQ